uniref:Signal recognition particle receptor subunit beta n=1 Tax=Fagus sylvatica TaxID=28930 RepID=A0A2N9IPU2_FAGSY
MEGAEQWKYQLEQWKNEVVQLLNHPSIEQWKNQFEQWLKQGIEYSHQIPPTQLYAALAVLLFTTLFFLFTRLFKRAKSDTIVLTGLSGSGKTVLFYQLLEFWRVPVRKRKCSVVDKAVMLCLTWCLGNSTVVELRDGSSHQGTVTSMEPNEGTFVLHSETTKKGKTKPVHLVDVPGHSRLRPKLDEFLPQAAGIVFVVDALEFLPNCRAASEYLYDILTKASVVKKKIPVLILCNKTDKVTAHTKEFIKKQMEKEVDKLRTSRSAISAADIANDYTLGIPGEAFSFSHCENKVTIAEASGSTGVISQVEQFIREHVKP